MKQLFCILNLISCLSISLYGQNRPQYDDGPFVYEYKKKYEVEWIQKGEHVKTKLKNPSDTTLSIPGLPIIDFSKLDFATDTTLHYDNVEKFAALSDIHGQYDLFLDLLKAQDVIDSTGSWSFGDGHLVIVGDIFDRGPKVTECLWFIFKLEQEAIASGGKVHFLLGNHEVMILHGQLGYINKKYRYSSGITQKPYQEFYSEKSVLGKWLRSKNITVCINDFVFVHGGFSKAVIDRENSLKKINSIFQNEIVPNVNTVYDTTARISDFYFENGPLWYRGYADPTKFDIEQAEYILEKLNKESIVIGHTSMPQVTSLHEHRIVLVDSSIKFGDSGEILLYDDDLLYRGLMNGDKILLVSKNKSIYQRSIFDFLHSEYTAENYSIKLSTDMKHLKKTKRKKDYQDAELSIYNGVLDTMHFDVRVKVRGNMRKEVCSMPPIKIDFGKKELNVFGFSSNDKLKLVLQCNSASHQDKYLYKEKLIYDLYAKVDTLGLRTKLINIELIDDEGKSTMHKAFLLEDEDNIAKRIQGRVIEKGVIRISGLQRESYVKMVFFQYMIMNTDWSIGGRHNTETVKVDHEDMLIAVPYDFDYSGLVGQSYAVPSPLFDIEAVRDRYFRGQYITSEEFDEVLSFYNSIKSDLLEVCEEAVHMDTKDRAKVEKDILDFYEVINNPKRKKSFVGQDRS